MIRLFIMCILIVFGTAETQLNLPSRHKLNKNLAQLQYFRTPKQNPLALYNKVDSAQKCLLDIRKQLKGYDNVVVGDNNKVDGSNNILVGNYDYLTGSNNFVFVDNYQGSAQGALLIGKWRIQLAKKQFIKIRPNYAIFMINQEENRKYERYLNRNRAWSYGSNLNKNMITLVKDMKDQIRQQLQTGLSSLNNKSTNNKIQNTVNTNSNINKYNNRNENKNLINPPKGNQVKSNNINNVNIGQINNIGKINNPQSTIVNPSSLNIQSQLVPNKIFIPNNDQLRSNGNFNNILNARNPLTLSNSFNSQNKITYTPINPPTVISETQSKSIITGNQYSNNINPINYNIGPSPIKWNIAQPISALNQNSYTISNTQNINKNNLINTPSFNSQTFNPYNSQIRQNLGPRYIRTSGNSFTNNQIPSNSPTQTSYPNQMQQNIGSPYSYLRGYN